ncbi:type II toxin-antitoxin system VapC family toxin [Collimonas pratensis]|uniref:PIN domain protein n=1 Tax=Collimonas pratensis TaxID=279113 RepID=A0A127Q6I1_9BURK|nr:type II toxin-antitoxin system VapC family toxin [Collimonas pratensis]AMP05637.1 PIN domain protein [Collimonas pratensis]AMP14326.1 PIN domain protein [Collimonas pratensis]
MYLLDTNVISESRKGAKANRGTQEFWRSVDLDAIYLPVQSIGEIRRGVEIVKRRGDSAQAKMLETWLQTLTTEYADRILSFDDDCAQVWGCLMSADNQHPIDKQIAAIALIHSMTVVTRNTGDFIGTGVDLINPFS